MLIVACSGIGLALVAAVKGELESADVHVIEVTQYVQATRRLLPCQKRCPPRKSPYYVL